jgi:hypothetical protein
MSIATRLQNAATKLLGWNGQSLTYKRGASTATINARVGLLGNGQKYEWFTVAETGGWDAPAYTLYVAGDFMPFSSEPTTSDSVLLNNYAGTGVQYDVKRWDKQRIGGIVIKTLLFVEKH